jgi:hypothetical protein
MGLGEGCMILRDATSKEIRDLTFRDPRIRSYQQEPENPCNFNYFPITGNNVQSFPCYPGNLQVTPIISNIVRGSNYNE